MVGRGPHSNNILKVHYQMLHCQAETQTLMILRMTRDKLTPTFIAHKFVGQACPPPCLHPCIPPLNSFVPLTRNLLLTRCDALDLCFVLCMHNYVLCLLFENFIMFVYVARYHMFTLLVSHVHTFSITCSHFQMSHVHIFTSFHLFCCINMQG